MTTVRSARTTDLPWLVPQLLAFLGSISLPLRPSEEYTLKTVAKLMDTGVVLVAENEAGDLMGTIGGTISFHLFDPDRLVLAELWWWVAPEYRGSSAGLRLIQAFRERGLQDVDLVTMSTLETTHPGVGEHLERMGFQRREQAYIMDVEAVLNTERLREVHNLPSTNGHLARQVLEGGV
jgi:RimJ/RimL family protein N-acetyltransferase